MSDASLKSMVKSLRVATDLCERDGRSNSAQLLRDVAERLTDLQAIVNTLPLNGDGDRITLGSKHWTKVPEWGQVTAYQISTDKVDVTDCQGDFIHLVPNDLFTTKPKEE